MDILNCVCAFLWDLQKECGCTKATSGKCCIQTRFEIWSYHQASPKDMHIPRSDCPLRFYIWNMFIGKAVFEKFLVCYATTHLAIQLPQERIQVVRSTMIARKRPAESNGSPAMDLGFEDIRKRKYTNKRGRNKTRERPLSPTISFLPCQIDGPLFDVGGLCNAPAAAAWAWY